MTLEEMEVALVQLQEQVNSNTTAINALANTISEYSDDDLATLAEEINILQKNHITLANSVSILSTSVKKIDHLGSLLDVSITNLTEGDVLQYSNLGKWCNIKANLTGSSNGTTGSVTSLNDLSDVSLSTLSDGHALVYNAATGKWINQIISTNGSGTGGNYLTKSQADLLYLSLNGGTVNGELIVKGLTTVDNDLLVSGGITMYNE